MVQKGKTHNYAMNLTKLVSGFFTWTKLITALPSICVGAYNFLANPENKNWTIVIVSSSAFIVICLVSYLTRRFSHTIISKIFSVFSRTMPYSLDEWNVTYEYETKTRMNFKAFYLVKALQTGVDNIRVRYNWSGDNPIAPYPITAGDCSTKNVEYIGQEFGYAYYRVNSTTKINKNDPSMKLGVSITNMEDPDMKASTHLLTNINVKTKLLIMTVILPEKYKFTNVEYLEYLHSTDDDHWHKYTAINHPKTVNITTNNNKTHITWTVHNPILGGKYIIRWKHLCENDNNH